VWIVIAADSWLNVLDDAVFLSPERRELQTRPGCVAEGQSTHSRRKPFDDVRIGSRPLRIVAPVVVELTPSE
jgi:hypothetical protein